MSVRQIYDKYNGEEEEDNLWLWACDKQKGKDS